MPRQTPLFRFRRRSPFILLTLLILWSFCIGWALSQAAQGQLPPTPPAIGTVDPTPPNYRVGEQLYVEHCGSCHVALPPAVMPTTTWRDL
ncbi:MAG: diheme cytochrome C, partial [Cyanobacteria bacterium J055]